jgi:2-methylisocitrate lyase-like PEP mutase family enzyme
MTQPYFAQFKALHFQNTPLLLPNAWDAASAVLLQMDGATAIATSSAAVAWSLGYADGGALPRAELLGAIGRIMRVVQVPVTVDLEDGYSQDPAAVADLVLQVARLGVVGINLEDGAGPADLLAAKIGAIRRALAGTPLYINARTDVYLKGLAKNAKGQSGPEAIALCAQRLQSYRAAGADGAFVPGMCTAADVAALLAQPGMPPDMPLNLMATPALAPTADLAAAGVRRISTGGSLFQTTYAYSRAPAKQFMAQGDTRGLFEHTLPYAMMNAAMPGK